MAFSPLFQRQNFDALRVFLFAMRQILLDLLPENRPDFANFLTGRNQTALQKLQNWLKENTDHSPDVFYLYGETGCGCSHLLAASGFALFDAKKDNALDTLVFSSALAIDHLDALDAAGQSRLFDIFNQIKMAGGKLLLAGKEAPLHLNWREDLRTRLGSGLLYRLRPLLEDEKRAALTALAESRAIKLPDAILNYLLHHCPRDMQSLSTIIAALDRYSLENQRPVTLPLLRDLLKALAEFSKP